MKTATFACLALVAFGCSSSSEDSNIGGVTEVQSKLVREQNPQVSEEDKAAFSTDNLKFTLDLYGQLKSRSGNIAFSSFSVSSALAMTYAGASGDTATQMATALRFSLPPKKLHAAFNAVDLALTSRAKDPVSDASEQSPFQLTVANSLWGQTGYHFESEFLDALAVNYGAGMNLVDFESNADVARQAINAWVSNATQEKIAELLASGTVDSATRLVLTNAIYFNASWADPFKKESTAKGDFETLGGDTKSVEFMHQTNSYAYAKGEDWSALRLPYVGNKLNMTVILPDSGKFDSVESSIGSDFFATLSTSLVDTRVNVALPKWKTESEFKLPTELKALGMVDAFTRNADFSKMTGKKELYISDVVHKAYVAVDEKGTEAAAATAVVMRKISADLPADVTFEVNRPFLFVIRDEPTNTVLFMGKVVDPS